MSFALDQERAARKSLLQSELRTADDPLEVYYGFATWIITNYGENNPKSGLVELLEEATARYKDDDTYKRDARYLKLWMFLAKQRDAHGADIIYATCIRHEIGTSLALLWEDCAALLESLDRCASQIQPVLCRNLIFPKGSRPPNGSIERVSANRRVPSKDYVLHTTDSRLVTQNLMLLRNRHLRLRWQGLGNPDTPS